MWPSSYPFPSFSLIRMWTGGRCQAAVKVMTCFVMRYAPQLALFSIALHSFDPQLYNDPITRANQPPLEKTRATTTGEAATAAIIRVRRLQQADVDVSAVCARQTGLVAYGRLRERGPEVQTMRQEGARDAHACGQGESPTRNGGGVQEATTMSAPFSFDENRLLRA